MNKTRKTILMSLIFILIICIFSATVFAEGADDGGIGQLVTDMKGQNIANGDNSGKIITSINTIIGMVQIAGTGVALIAVSLLGIKYMLASAEDKAEIKKYMVGAIIGGLLIFGGSEIAQILANFSGQVFGGGEN